MVVLLSGRNGLHVQRPAVLRRCACVCVFARNLLQLTEERIVPVGDSKLNIVNPRNALKNLVNTFVKGCVH